jgi:hypothetical protein
MTLRPKTLLIYYGYPSQINNAGTLDEAATELGRYDYLVLGDGLELPTHEDHQKTAAILKTKALLKSTVFGYIYLGVNHDNQSVPALTMQEIRERISLWRDMGVGGIFLDEFGFDYGFDSQQTRLRQNEAVDAAHALKLPVIANAWALDDAFGAVDEMESVLPPHHLTKGDFYLYESHQWKEGKYETRDNWRVKAEKLEKYSLESGFKIMSVTTELAGNPYQERAFHYSWFSALLYNHEATAWGEADFSSETSQAPFRARPQVEPGNVFKGGVTISGNSFSRKTDMGEVVVDAGKHTYNFKKGVVPLLPKPSKVLALGAGLRIAFTGLRLLRKKSSRGFFRERYKNPFEGARGLPIADINYVDSSHHLRRHINHE